MLGRRRQGTSREGAALAGGPVRRRASCGQGWALGAPGQDEAPGPTPALAALGSAGIVPESLPLMALLFLCPSLVKNSV